jgi:hypothetical protein
VKSSVLDPYRRTKVAHSPPEHQENSGTDRWSDADKTDFDRITQVVFLKRLAILPTKEVRSVPEIVPFSASKYLIHWYRRVSCSQNCRTALINVSAMQSTRSLLRREPCHYRKERKNVDHVILSGLEQTSMLQRCGH